MLSHNVKQLNRRYENLTGANIGSQFIQPCLNECIKYRRGTGYFSSSALLTWAGALENIIKNKRNVEIEILCSPVIHDKKLLKSMDENVTDEEKENTLLKYAEGIVKIACNFNKYKENDKSNYRSKLLAYLIANDILKIKIALLKGQIPSQWPSEIEMESNDKSFNNIYHVKQGYFEFPDGEKIAFQGSFNETDSGHRFNYETTHVYKSWTPEGKVWCKDVVEDVDRDWNNENKDAYEVRDISKELIDEIKKIAPKEKPTFHNNSNKEIHDEFNLRHYQKEAIDSWKKNNHVGMFEMATGSGKTRTAISIIKEFNNQNPKSFKIIDVPKISLARQWERELKQYDLKSIGLYTAQNWENKINEILFACKMNFKFDEIPCFVTVSRTFQSEKFQEILKKIDELNIKENLLVVDECHHYNKLSAIGKLPEFINHRVGLSATLYDKYIYDENGKEDESKIFLTKYFKKIVISYKLEDAIREKNLVPYNYKLIPIKLNDFEIDDLNEISEEISRQFAIKENGESNKDNDKSLQYNLAKRASLLASASEKIIKLKNLLTQISPIKNTLIYCGTTIEEDQTDYEKQIDKVQKILFEDFNIRSSRVTADETATQRDDIIDRFTKRNIDALVSIRVLDEGIDIPSCQQAIILASDKSDRQFIQRRGRVLRRDDAGGKKEANIYDFVIIGGTKKSVHLDKQISDEIFRVKEFASLALNKDDIYNEFKHLLNEN